MQETKELNALFTLIDDPDEEVYTSVTDRILDYGKPIIPNLEHLWENTPNEDIQERIEMIIHRLHFRDLSEDLMAWKDSPYHDLLLGALLVCKYQYPDLQTAPCIQDLEKIKRNVWLELNQYLTPLEQANVLSSIVYNYYQLKAVEPDHTQPDAFFLHKVLETKKGSALCNGILYQILCEQLDISARLVSIPRQCLIAFFHHDYDDVTDAGHPQERIQFYVDAQTGQAYSNQDLENYLKRLALPHLPEYFRPIPAVQLIQRLLEELTLCFERPDHWYKKEELTLLVQRLKD